MERAGRHLLLFSLVSLLAVLALGVARASPSVRALIDTPESVKSLGAFHAHFDSLCWLGSAAAGAALLGLGRAWRGPAWLPAAFAWSYIPGTLLFATSYGLKGLGERLGSPLLARGAFFTLASVGGSCLFVTIGAGAALAWRTFAEVGVSDPAAG